MRFSKRLAGASLLSIAVAVPTPDLAPIPGVKIREIEGSTADIIPNSWIIHYKTGIPTVEIAQHRSLIQSKLGKAPEAVFTVPGFNAVHVKTDSHGLAKIAVSSTISYVDRDMRISLDSKKKATMSLPTARLVTYLGIQRRAVWGLGRISHQDRGDPNYIYDFSACNNTVAYIIDTGIRTTHQEFKGRATWGANFIDNSNKDERGHGTHVAGTIIGSRVGVCKQGKVIAVKVLNGNGSGSWSSLMKGIDWAYNNAVATGRLKTSVQSISINGGNFKPVNDLITKIVSLGMPVIVAAGNSAGNSTEYSPSGARLAITVGATDPSDNRAAFSNYGVGVDIFAPGVGIFSAVGACDTCYSTLDGTSMATPYVTGLSMYFMSKDKLVGPLAVLKRLVEASLPKVSAQTLMGSPNRLAYNGNGF